MAGIDILEVSMTVSVRLSDDTLREQMGEMVLALGPNLAQQVHDYVQREHLGYYPALDYFGEHRRSSAVGIDPELLSAAEHVAWLISEFTRRLIKKQLREPFSSVRFDKTQAVAFSMPKVRPQDPNALTMLARHYAPNMLRLVMTISSIEKAGINPEGYERLVRHKALRWLEPHFESVEITDARLLADAGS